MRELIQIITDTLQRGETGVLCTVVKKTGSVPRGLGAAMFVTRGGSAYGTVGGGAIEHKALCHARELTDAAQGGTESYRLNTGSAADLGMVCGGTADILFEPLTKADAPLYAALAEALFQRRSVALRRVVANGAVTLSEMAVTAGEKPSFTDGVLLEPLLPAGRVYVFGGGHVSAELVPMLSHVGFSVAVLDDRADFISQARFPSAEERQLLDFSNDAAFPQLTAQDYAVAMTRGHAYDYEILRRVLRSEARYVGCIGSSHKIAVTRQKLLDDGLSKTAVERVKTPIGLPIGAETPAEIAVSVCAEMIRCRAGLPLA